MKIKIKNWFSGILCMALLIAGAGLCVPVTAQAADTAKSTESMDAEELPGDVKEKISDAVAEMDPKTVKEIFQFVSEKLSDGSLDTEDGLKAAIQESEEKFGITIKEADARKVVEAMQKLEDMGFSADYVLNKAESLYDKYGADFVDHTNEIIKGAVENAVKNAAESFFSNLWQSTKNFFSGLLGCFRTADRQWEGKQ